jgi:hypothetical protein
MLPSAAINESEALIVESFKLESKSFFYLQFAMKCLALLLQEDRAFVQTTSLQDVNSLEYNLGLSMFRTV